MTRMERLADWLGAIATGPAWRRTAIRLGDTSERLLDAFNEIYDDRERLETALRTIAAMETPHANATVTRMAKVAEEALR